LVIVGYSHRTVTLLYIGLAAVGLLLAALWHAGGLVSDATVVLALPLLYLGLWRGVVGCARAARHKPLSDRSSRRTGIRCGTLRV
jgi:hypothetical protein